LYIVPGGFLVFAAADPELCIISTIKRDESVTGTFVSSNNTITAGSIFGLLNSKAAISNTTVMGDITF